MPLKMWMIAILLLVCGRSYAGGLSAAVFPCEREDKQVAASIPGDIATAVVRSLLGTAIDAAVAYLDDPRASAFDVVLPVESIEDITSGNSKNCLYLSSGRLDVLANPNG